VAQKFNENTAVILGVCLLNVPLKMRSSKLILYMTKVTKCIQVFQQSNFKFRRKFTTLLDSYLDYCLHLGKRLDVK